MFVTSKRCFINILAQFMTPKQLLEATYYISDVGNTAGRRLSFDKEVVYHDDGTFEIKTKIILQLWSKTSLHQVAYLDYLPLNL